MDSRFLNLYDTELSHLREMGGEFAREYPKIAGRLALEQFSCADPYVERLLEGFAFLAARVQLKLEAEFPRFTQGLLRSFYPDYLNPTPSCCIARFEIEPADQSLANGYSIPRGSSLKSPLLHGERTACEFRTAHDVTLLPIRVAQAAYTSRQMSALQLPAGLDGVRAALRIRLQTTHGEGFGKLPIDALKFYLNGTEGVQSRLYESLTGRARHVVVQSVGPRNRWRHVLPASTRVVPRGFDDRDALLPVGPRTYSGYRLLREYFALPARYFFVDLAGLDVLRGVPDDVVDVLVTFDAAADDLEGAVQAETLALHCTPAVNLFPRRADRVQLNDAIAEHPLIPDRNRPKDFEVYDVTSVAGIGDSAQDVRPFRPIYSAKDGDEAATSRAYYSLHREPRIDTQQERRHGRRAQYVGSEVFISLVDANEAPISIDVRQLAIETLCTNRDLPLLLGADLPLTSDAGPVRDVRFIGGAPTPPRPAPANGSIPWRAISHLTLNYLSLVDQEGAAGLRDLLSLYADLGDQASRRQIDGVRGVRSEPVVRRIRTRGPIAFARGLAISVELDEASFAGASPFLMGAVLERFFAGYTSINSFVETRIWSAARGDIMTWPSRSSTRPIL